MDPLNTSNEPRSKAFVVITAALLSCLATACCTTRQLPNAGRAVAQYQFETNSFQRALSSLQRSPEENVDMLVLSGGGSHGAWGAGVLRGWRENADHPRPGKFSVVTGVSTGALLATYAFLGEPEDDDLLERAYTTAKTSDIYRKKFLLFALFSDSLYSSKPLAGRIRQYISPETIDRVAAEARAGRRLYVGTVNHDTGRLVVWDLTELAKDTNNPGRLELYRKVVLASASIPILVPPVEIDGNLYADGGARAQLFFEKGFFPELHHASGEKPHHPNLTLDIIVNGKLGLERTNVNDCLKAITTRTLDELLDANEIGDLYHLEYVLKLNGYGHFALSYIPDEVPVTTSDVFDPKMMRSLYEAGRRFGATQSKWLNHPPYLDLNRH